MIKKLLIIWDTDTASMYTEYGDGVTAGDAVDMCEYALGEAEYENEEE